jgi:ech hydrogenase subunit D
MSIEAQRIEEIPTGTLLERVQGMRTEGWRLAQICCTRLVADQEVSYSFDRDAVYAGNAGNAGDAGQPDSASPAEGLYTLRVRVPIHDPELPSVSSFYWSAFLYENEMHDLFGVKVKGMAVDFKGHLFTTLVPTPFVTKDTEHGD